MRKTKALGQHFLTSRTVLRKIVEVISPQRDELVIEIGAGKGALTFPLAERAGKVIAVEKDGALIPFLLEHRRPNVVVRHEDVLRLDFRDLLAGEAVFGGKVKLAGNLPYSISSPLLFKVLEDKDVFTACVFLLQKEVAERLSAKPGSKKHAPLSILFQMHFDVRLRFALPPGAFSPPPRVQSALISLTRRPRPLFPVADEDRFRRFLRAAFAQRRKTLLNNLKSARYPLGLLRESFRDLSLNETVRAEQLSIAQFADLFEALGRG
ncbi:MAG: ribosomal RNA small subunit methyltransferase A [Candidatus Aminicenantes bacterium]|nr:ribosomal RNA small subunit methyltransferase A [Candidatus Aminicenantes bacterium]